MKKALQLLAVVKVMSMLLIAIMTVVIQGCQKEDTSGEGTSRPVNLANLNLQDANEIFAQNSSQSTRSGDDNGLFKITRSGEIVNVTLSGENGEEIQATNVELSDFTKNYFFLSYNYPIVAQDGDVFTNTNYHLIKKATGEVLKLPWGLENTSTDDWRVHEDGKNNLYISNSSGVYHVVNEGNFDGEKVDHHSRMELDYDGNIYENTGQHKFTPYQKSSFIVGDEELGNKTAVLSIPFRENGGFLILSSKWNKEYDGQPSTEEYICTNSIITINDEGKIVVEEIPQIFTNKMRPHVVGNSIVYNPAYPYNRPIATRSENNQSLNEMIILGNDMSSSTIQLESGITLYNHYYTTNNFAYWVSEDWSVYEYSSAKQEVNKIFTADSSMNISIVEPFCVDNFVRFFVEQGGKKYVYIIQDGILSTYGETDEKYSYYANMTSLVAM